MMNLVILVSGIVLLSLGFSLAPSGTEDLFYLYLALLVVIPFTILTISTFSRMVVDRIRLAERK